MKPVELKIITSGTSGTYNIRFLEHLNVGTYSFVLDPAYYWFDDLQVQEIDAWCTENIGQKYATWSRNMNRWEFFKREHQVACELTWGHENRKD